MKTDVSIGELGIAVEVDVPDDFLSDEDFMAGLSDAFQKAVNEAVDFWKTAAGQRLNTTRDQYISAIRGDVVTDSDGMPIADLRLEGDELVSAIETGAPGFDMKPGFLAGKTFARVPVAPDTIRTVNLDTSANKFLHPGWPGLNIREDVANELLDNILPKHITALMDEVF